jgi:hypothetical protein
MLLLLNPTLSFRTMSLCKVDAKKLKFYIKGYDIILFLKFKFCFWLVEITISLDCGACPCYVDSEYAHGGKQYSGRLQVHPLRTQGAHMIGQKSVLLCVRHTSFELSGNISYLRHVSDSYSTFRSAYFYPL